MTSFRTLLIASALLAGTASAGDIYATTGLVFGSFDATPPPGCTLNDSSASGVGGAVGIGYAFDPTWSFEAGYVTLGSLDIHGVCGITPFTLATPDSGLTASGIGRLDLDSRWDLFGRVGFYSWSAAAQSDTELVLGVGAEYEWSKVWTARLEYTQLGSDLSAVGVSVRIAF